MTEDCTTSYQISFKNDRNEDNYGSFESFEDPDCDGTIDSTFEGSYIFEDGSSFLTINYSTGFRDYIVEELTEDELVIYNNLDGYLYFKKITDDSPDNPNPGEELIADFEILPLCCPPATASGRYFDEVQIEFENRSSGNIVEYQWSFGSTEENPTETFGISNHFNTNTLEFELTVVDDQGNTDSIEKSIELPTLVASGNITFGGQSCQINYYDSDPDYPLTPPFYMSIMDLGEWVGYSINDINLAGCDGVVSPVIQLGGYLPGQRVTMTQVGEYTPSNPSNFYVSFGAYRTFDDSEGLYSSGGVDISGIEDGAKIITSLSLSGRVENNYTGDIKDFEIELNYIPHICYYNYTTLCNAQPEQ